MMVSWDWNRVVMAVDRQIVITHLVPAFTHQGFTLKVSSMFIATQINVALALEFQILKFPNECDG